MPRNPTPEELSLNSTIRASIAAAIVTERKRIAELEGILQGIVDAWHDRTPVRAPYTVAEGIDMAQAALGNSEKR